MGEQFSNFAVQNYAPNPDDIVLDSLFKQYEYVIVNSLITTFGLDFLVADRHGGDVDTIHNVRQIGTDGNMAYKNSKNATSYENHGEYNSIEYHSDNAYKTKNKTISEARKSGKLRDEYTGKIIPGNKGSDLDHVISAKEIHDDRGRVLSGIKGTDLANSNENLKATNPHTNRSKKADSMETFLEKHGNEYSESEKVRMRNIDKEARKSYETKLSKQYYSSKQFKTDVVKAAGKVGIEMGLRQALGMILTEVWFHIRDEFDRIKGKFDMGLFFISVGNGIKRGFASAKEKYKEIIAKFKDGVLAGALASLTTTLCNIFFTTAKNIVRVIRQTWNSLVDAAKVLFVNPDNLTFKERMIAVAKIVSVGASTVVGVLVNEMINDSPVGKIPIIGDIVSTFCGTLVTGILSCTLLYFIDNSDVLKNLLPDIIRFNAVAAGAMIGQAIIPIPVVGGIVGSVIGYALSSECVALLTKTLKEASLAKEERIKIEKECAEAILALKKYKQELQEKISNYLIDFITTFNEAFDQIDEAIYNDDIDGFISGNNKIQVALGYKPQFNSFNEFDAFMQSEQAFKL